MESASTSLASPHPTLSLIIPMRNEEEGLDLLFSRLETILDEHKIDYELLTVNDGSTDRTMEFLLKHRQRNPRIKILNLTRNYGKDNALSAGLDYATGDAVIPLDADLQDPPELIPAMVNKWREGWDVVYGKRVDRATDSAVKRMSAGWFYKLFNAVSEISIPENTGDFRLMDRVVVEKVRLLHERNRFMKGLFAWVGFRCTSVEYARPERAAGTTKWNYWKLWNFALGGIMAFSTLPLRIWTYVGALISVSAFGYALFLIALKIGWGIATPGYASIMVAVLCLGGLQLLTLGIIGEYLGRIYLEVKGRPLYLVRETHGIDPANAPRK
ncbi:MAG: glycosyltransferase family 2 protein [Verrucomicrobiota bacterium]|nr:glycosyltransferase family 2 protein [Verrucomicrobiota bacterium]